MLSGFGNICHFSFRDVGYFFKILKGIWDTGIPHPFQGLNSVKLRTLACLRASFSPLNCTKTIFCHMASPMDPYRGEPP